MRHSDIYKRIYPKAGESAKTKNPNLQKKAENLRGKLGKYAMASAALVAAMPNTAEAAIVVNDISDVTITRTGIQTTYAVNIDGAGGTEITLGFGTSGGNPNLLPILGTNVQIVGYPVPGSTSLGTLSRLGYQATINNGLTFVATNPASAATTFLSMNFNSTLGLWAGGNQAGFLGMQFQIGANTHFGWIQLVVNDVNSITIKAWAYENTPNTPIATPAAPVTPQVPTLSEWGLITLAIFLLSFGTLYIGRREEILAAQSSSGGQFKMGHFWQKPPFEWAVFWKTLLATAGLAGIAGGLSLFAYGTIAATDLIGTAIAGPLFAYLMHLLWIFERDSKE